MRLEARRYGKRVADVRRERIKRDRAIAHDAAALGASEQDIRRASSNWLDGTMVIASRFGPLHLRPKDTDMLVIQQVLVGDEYDLGKADRPGTGIDQMRRIEAAYAKMLADRQIPVIIDAGANIGAASRWFALRFPEAKIIGVEPDPGNAAIARLNAAERDNVHVVEAALGSAPGFIKLQTFENQGWGARTARADVGIQVVTVSELVGGIPNGKLLITKIDIEGFEADLFASNTGWVDETFAIILEPHDWMMPGAGTSQSFQRALLGKGRELLISGENLVFV